MERAGCVWPPTLQPATVLVAQDCHPSAARRWLGPSWPQALRTCPAPVQGQTTQPAGLGPPRQRPPPSAGTALKHLSALCRPWPPPLFSLSLSSIHSFPATWLLPTNEARWVPLPEGMSPSPQAAPSHLVTTSCWLFLQNSTRG